MKVTILMAVEHEASTGCDERREMSVVIKGTPGSDQRADVICEHLADEMDRLQGIAMRLLTSEEPAPDAVAARPPATA